jgi:hypothetical protein
MGPLNPIRIWIEWHAVTLTALGTAALAVAALAALVIAYLHLREARQNAKIERLLHLERQYSSPPLDAFRSVWAKKRLAGEAQPGELRWLLDFFETIGLLVKRNYVDAHDVWETFGYAILCLFADAQEHLRQEQRDDPAFHANLTKLAEQMRAIEAKEKGAYATPSSDDLRRFLEEEASFSPAPLSRPGRKAKR